MRMFFACKKDALNTRIYEHTDVPISEYTHILIYEYTWKHIL